MNGENGPLITNEPANFVEKPVELLDFMKVTIILEESMEHFQIFKGKGKDQYVTSRIWQ